MFASFPAQGLYDPAFEHDACGVGFICRLDNVASHTIVEQGLTILRNLDHRGACGCDARTGDGAGILIQMPDAFLQAVAAGHGIALPEPGRYGAGLVFLPRTADPQPFMAMAAQAAAAEGCRVLGWRPVPTDNADLGVGARENEPTVWQLFVAGTQDGSEASLERRLFMLRKRFTRAVRRSEVPGHEDTYVVSLSTRTLTYKGMLTPGQVPGYFPDLRDPRMASALALVHARFSTNTMPRWPLAQPFRLLCHNGEINTLRGNVHWMKAREALFAATDHPAERAALMPFLTEGGSDSQILDNALELLTLTGRSLPHAVLMLLPEAWEHHPAMADERRAFYEYHACLMEPWDGPATVPFTDGRYLGAVLDRNGLRPSRYTVTKDGYVILSSEAGVVDVDPANVAEKGRLAPGRMFLVDLAAHRIIPDEEIKGALSRAHPYRAWLDAHLVHLSDVPLAEGPRLDGDTRLMQQRLFGYSLEDLRLVLEPSAGAGKEPTGSMGNDTPLAVLSDRPRLLYDYFKQLFAQVTNPPLDAIREEMVTSLTSYLGASGDLFEVRPEQARRLKLEQPILRVPELEGLRGLDRQGLRTAALTTLFDPDGGGTALQAALDRLCSEASRAVDDGATLLILSDRRADAAHAPIPALLATGAVHHHLIRTGQRMRCSLIVESGEPREVHHACMLIGYGAEAVCPYLALETVRALAGDGGLTGLQPDAAEAHYVQALGQGILKVMSKMGISTLQSYCGAQIFEAVGLAKSVIRLHFTGTVSRLGGLDLDGIAEESRRRHAAAFPSVEVPGTLDLDVGGLHQWRRNGEHHLFNPLTIAHLQHAVQQDRPETYQAFADAINEQARHLGTLRGLLDFEDDPARALPLDEVEPWTEIVRRFKTGAMSYGSLSQETHETLAVAMNQIGGRSNTGEGGEPPERYAPHHPARSRIKQVASGRFGVTISYLASADEIQIKMAQGAKPGEGGQLPGQKVFPRIARTRHATPFVGLISPPPHHDIYSIEDLAQLIHDLKNASPSARISVKLVAKAGVGTIAAGVAKGKAEVILISGYDGGTGASAQTSIMHAGLPWELGLAEAHQTLVLNGLRSRVKLECDGQLKTGRDVALAALLGADEFGFATAPLVALGCIMMRKCHLNTCPVGIATQDPELRKQFTGQPEHVVRYLHFVAEELRQIMARLGFRTVDAMVGRVDRLRQRRTDHWKARHLDLAPLLHQPKTPEALLAFDEQGQDHGLAQALDNTFIADAAPALERGERVTLDVEVRNTHRTLGTLLSHAVTERYGPDGLPPDTITVRATGSAGQSCGAFLAPGITLRITGEVNDYAGKGLSGGTIIVSPSDAVTYAPSRHIAIGNVALYGATSGELYVRGQAGERFAVRNSGARAVVEGIGHHGCEYMTGGRVVILGPTGYNFAAGMSGGIAYVLDGTGEFRNGRCTTPLVDLCEVNAPDDIAELRALVQNHFVLTGSDVARWVLDHWQQALREFVKVFPIEYRNALSRQDPTDPPAEMLAA